MTGLEATMAKTKSIKKKASKTTARTTKAVAPAAKSTAKKAKTATSAKAVRAKAPAVAPTKAKITKTAPAKVKATAVARKASVKPIPPPQTKATTPPAPETNWTDAIKAALERRHQQADYPGSGSNSWKNRPKH
jgi:DNA-binding protein HU-beta